VKCQDLVENPYEVVAQSSKPGTHYRKHWYRTYLVPLSQIACWFGMMLFVSGSFISFYPGAEASWFAITAAFVGFGLCVPSKNYRIVSIVIVAICLFWIYAGYQRGIKHQERRRELDHLDFPQNTEPNDPLAKRPA
jgi:hypothetical protein